jgi:hypothetical protein
LLAAALDVEIIAQTIGIEEIRLTEKNVSVWKRHVHRAALRLPMLVFFRTATPDTPAKLRALLIRHKSALCR